MIRSVPVPNGISKEQLHVKKKRVPVVPDYLFPLHSLMAFVGPVGCGKTHECVKLTLAYLEAKSINQLYIISPTFEQNNVFAEFDKYVDELYTYRTYDGDIALNNTMGCIYEILGLILESMKEFNAYEEYMKVYKKYKRGEKLTHKEQDELYLNGWQPLPEVKFPAPYLILDDLSRTDIYSTGRDNPFNNLCLRHRHYKLCGITIVMLVQNFTNGLPKFIRQNVGQFFIYKTFDKTNIQNIYEQIASIVTEDEFLALFNAAIQDPHDFLTINLREEDHNKQFRRNFNEFLIPPRNPEIHDQKNIPPHQEEDFYHHQLVSKKRK
jgi:hypothetical protein